MNHIIKFLTIGYFIFLTACNNDSSSPSRSSITPEPTSTLNEFRRISIGGTANTENILGLSCEINDAPIVQNIIVGLGLRQNMELIQSTETGMVTNLNLGRSEANVVIVFNWLVNQGVRNFASLTTNNFVEVELSNNNGTETYKFTLEDGSILELSKITDDVGNVSYAKSGSNAQVICEEFTSLTDVMNQINTNPAVDPNIQGQQ